MQPRIIEGVWEDVAAKHAKTLKGRRVEIRVLDKGQQTRTPTQSWAEFEREVAKITRGIRIPDNKLYTASDFYESED